MKLILLTLLLSSFALNGHAAAEKRVITKLSSSQLRVKIETEERQSTQAASYVDARENVNFINFMLKDKMSSLGKLKIQIEKDFCSFDLSPERERVEGCGEVTLTKEVRTSFARSGWMSGVATYTFFIGFTADGSGRHFYATHMVTFSENAEAQVNREGAYMGIVLKTIEMGKITELEDTTP